MLFVVGFTFSTTTSIDIQAGAPCVTLAPCVTVPPVGPLHCMLHFIGRKQQNFYNCWPQKELQHDDNFSFLLRVMILTIIQIIHIMQLWEIVVKQ